MTIRYRIQLKLVLAIIAFGLVLTGCGAKYTATEITNEPRTQTLDGVPFRIKEFYKPELYKLDRATGKYVLQNSPGLTQGEKTARHVTLANPDRLFLLKFHGDALADVSPSFGLNQDGTLSSASVTFEDKSLQTLSTLTTEIEEFRAARQAGKPTPPSSEDLKNYLDALHEAENAVIAYESLDEDNDGSSEAIRTARQAMEKAKLAANQAARAAGRSLPYPDFKL